MASAFLKNRRSETGNSHEPGATMLINCPTCLSRFQYDETRFAGASSKKFKCTKCGILFEVSNPFLSDSSADSGDYDGFCQDRPPLMLARAGESDNAEPQYDGPPCLVFLTGPKASMSLDLISPRTVLGRDSGDIAMMDPETSRQHAMIEIMDDGSVWLMDLGSKNGTYTNGAPIAGRIRLRDRQEFICGKSSFMIRVP